jgi:hypothetical protein
VVKIKLNKITKTAFKKIKIMTAHEIDYQIFGRNAICREIELDPQNCNLDGLMDGQDPNGNDFRRWFRANQASLAFKCW